MLKLMGKKNIYNVTIKKMCLSKPMYLTIKLQRLTRILKYRIKQVYSMGITLISLHECLCSHMTKRFPIICLIVYCRVLVVNNPLFHSRNTVVSVLVNSAYIQVTHDGKPVRTQISPVFENNNAVLENQYMVN